MMFESHIAFGVNLLALVAAAALLGLAAKTEACCKSLMKSVAYIVLVSGTLNLLCTSYYTVKYWEDGYFKTPYSAQCPMMNGQGMIQNGMMNGDMMKMMNMMGGMKNQGMTPDGNQIPNGDSTNQDHDAHHPDQGK